MSKTSYFILEGLNSFATVYYAYYLFFFMQRVFGFGNKANLALAALYGAIYMIGSWCGGRFAQRFGYFTALKLGFVIMIVALSVGARIESATGQILVMAGTVAGMCFTWPTLEALVSEGETPLGLQRVVGLYNVVWAGTGALSYFVGGAMLDRLGLKSLFYVPVAILFVELGLTLWLEARNRAAAAQDSSSQVRSDDKNPNPEPVQSLNLRPIAKAKSFLRMAWLANPFAYIAINTLIAVMPDIAKRLELSTTFAGFCGSIWCFARVGAFFALWFWDAWHYRFRWLLAAFLALIASFSVILMVPNLAVLVLTQLLFGGAVGLIYYSSLFYSMDISEKKGEHGGIHEAAIGLGNFAGPAIGAASLHFLPQHPDSGAMAVSVLLIFGLGGLLVIWRMRDKKSLTCD
jgi:predicted MFS family arabinose efflux permease